MEPGHLFLQRTIRPTYVRYDQPYAAPVTAPAVPTLVPGQFFGPGLLAELALDKYLAHQPLYRQPKAIAGSKVWTCRFPPSARPWAEPLVQSHWSSNTWPWKCGLEGMCSLI